MDFGFKMKVERTDMLLIPGKKNVEETFKKNHKVMSNSTLYLNSLTLYAQQQEPLQKA